MAHFFYCNTPGQDLHYSFELFEFQQCSGGYLSLLLLVNILYNKIENHVWNLLIIDVRLEKSSFLDKKPIVYCCRISTQ